MDIIVKSIDNLQVENEIFCNMGSVAAGEGSGGVRPSSGAALLESDGDVMEYGAFACSALAVPEDGRTPLTSRPPSLTQYFWRKMFVAPEPFHAILELADQKMFRAPERRAGGHVASGSDWWQRGG